jgi:hypothetical protein
MIRLEPQSRPAAKRFLTVFDQALSRRGYNRGPDGATANEPGCPVRRAAAMGSQLPGFAYDPSLSFIPTALRISTIALFSKLKVATLLPGRYFSKVSLSTISLSDFGKARTEVRTHETLTSLDREHNRLLPSPNL